MREGLRKIVSISPPQGAELRAPWVVPGLPRSFSALPVPHAAEAKDGEPVDPIAGQGSRAGHRRRS